MQVRFFFLITLVLVSCTGFAQNGWNTFPESNSEKQDTLVGEGIVSDTMPATVQPTRINVTPGTLTISVSPNIVAVDEQLKKEAKNDPRIKGYTVLIFSGSGANSKLNAHNRKNEFQELFPDYISHLTWKSPNYEVRVGDFRTKIEAEKVLQEVKGEFPSAIVRADLIELPELNEPK